MAAMSITQSQEALMGKAVPAQHPAVVLRSQFEIVRTLLAAAMIAVVGLSLAIVILASDANHVSNAGTSSSGRAKRWPIPRLCASSFS